MTVYDLISLLWANLKIEKPLEEIITGRKNYKPNLNLRLKKVMYTIHIYLIYKK